MRAETAYRDLNALPPSQRKLARARVAHANDFDAIMHEHWLRGDVSLSNVAVARACDIDEKTVRQWRDGEKPMPAAATRLLPSRLREHLREREDAACGRAPKRGVALVREGLAALRREVASEDPREMRRAIKDAQRELLELTDVLDEARS